MSSSPRLKKKPVRCPVCRESAVEAYRPFCSKRCADIDLGKWFSGAYAVPGRDEDEGDGPGSSQGGDGPDQDKSKL